MRSMRADRQISVEQATEASNPSLRFVGMAAMKPRNRIASVADDPGLRAYLEIRGSALISWKHQALELEAKPTRRDTGGIQVGFERLDILAFFQAVVMRESVSGNLLVFGGCDKTDQARRKENGVECLACSFRRQICIGKKFLLSIGRSNTWQQFPKGRGIVSEEETHGCPRGVDPVFRKQIKHCVNRGAASD